MRESVQYNVSNKALHKKVGIWRLIKHIIVWHLGKIVWAGKTLLKLLAIKLH